MQTYDDIAEWYDQWIGPDAMDQDAYFPAVEALIGDVRGKRICDLACGQGRVARHLADRGAQVVGVDFSAKLLDIARRYEAQTPRGISYIHADAQRLDDASLGAFDGVVCNMALMDIHEVLPTLHGVARILQPGGWFVFSVLHPCFHTSQSGEIDTPSGAVRTIRQYFTEGYWRSDTRPGPPGKVGAYHRTLTTYINAISDAGLRLHRISEPRPGGAHPTAAAMSGAARPVWHEVPAALVARCEKPDGR